MRAFALFLIRTTEINLTRHVSIYRNYLGKSYAEAVPVRSAELLEIICNSGEQFDRFCSLLKPVICAVKLMLAIKNPCLSVNQVEDGSCFTSRGF